MEILSKLVIVIVQGYKFFVSPFLPPACRFYPTCSNYAQEAVIQHGLLYGFCLGLFRLLRCNPFFSAGYDPIPLTKQKHKLAKSN